MPGAAHLARPLPDRGRQLAEVSKAEADEITAAHDAREKADLDTAYGVVERGRRPREYCAGLATSRAPEDPGQAAPARRHRPRADRPVSVYRDAIAIAVRRSGRTGQRGHPAPRSSASLEPSSPELNLQRIGAIFDGAGTDVGVQCADRLGAGVDDGGAAGPARADWCTGPEETIREAVDRGGPVIWALVTRHRPDGRDHPGDRRRGRGRPDRDARRRLRPLVCDDDRAARRTRTAGAQCLYGQQLTGSLRPQRVQRASRCRSTTPTRRAETIAIALEIPAGESDGSARWWSTRADLVRPAPTTASERPHFGSRPAASLRHRRLRPSRHR